MRLNTKERKYNRQIRVRNNWLLLAVILDGQRKILTLWTIENIWKEMSESLKYEK